MKVINFTAVEVLPALLAGTKTQTIRLLKGKPRINVGDEVQLMWHQRTSPKDSWFCSECGNKVKATIDDYPFYCHNCKKYVKGFPKIIRTVTIKERFGIEMEATDGLEATRIWLLGEHNFLSLDKVKEIAKRDGFGGEQEMFKWFDEHYDLDEPKKLVVYRW